MHCFMLVYTKLIEKYLSFFPSLCTPFNSVRKEDEGRWRRRRRKKKKYNKATKAESVELIKIKLFQLVTIRRRLSKDKKGSKYSLTH